MGLIPKWAHCSKSNFKNDIVNAKNAEINNYVIMCIFNEVNNKLIKGPPNYICIPNLKKNPPIVHSHFTMISPLAVSILNNANQLIRYNNQLTVVEPCFTNIAAIQNMGVL